MQKILDIINLIDSAIMQDWVNTLTSGWIINDWYNNEVDKYRGIIKNSKDWLANYQTKLVGKSGISKLKIKYTNASGYFIEISKSQISQVPDSFIHKQSLVNASRFITPELKDFEKDLMNAEGILSELEYNLFLELREKILDSFEDIKQISKKSGYIDFGNWLAKVAYENNYSRPKVSNSYDLKIQNWRHPIIEQIQKDFISNSLDLNKNSFVHTITWPNMWGKSTFLRQNALIILLAHIWSFIPASKAEIPLTDKLFSRVWATDNLYLWQSTFMVEMQEVANILNNSTKNSFVIIDEVGRWTSTFDWMSLAWAILKENHDNIKAKTLFATHYHELIDESKSLKWVANFSVAVWENDENLIFLRKIIPWGLKKSFWLQVAKLAGLSENVLKTAKDMLLNLEKSNIHQLSLNLSENKVESSKDTLQCVSTKKIRTWRKIWKTRHKFNDTNGCTKFFIWVEKIKIDYKTKKLIINLYIF